MKKTLRLSISFIIISILLACATPKSPTSTFSPPTSTGIPINATIPLDTPTQIPEPTLTSTEIPTSFSTPLDTPTNTPEPTPTLIPTNTPVGQIFRDEFTASLQAGWDWQNENPSRWVITPDGWLQITGEDASLLVGEIQSNLLCRNAPEGDFQITVHLFADPIANFQQATLYLYQDADNYVAINRGYCSVCETGGSGLFMEYKFAGSWGAYNVATQDTDVFLQLVSQERTVSGYYALEEGEWNNFGKVGNYLEQAIVCLGVTNVDTQGINADLVGRFNYIEISLP